MTAKPTAQEQAEALCAGMTSRWRADRVRALELLIIAQGEPLGYEVIDWLPSDKDWQGCFNCWLFVPIGHKGHNSHLSRVSLSRHAKKQLGWPVESGPARPVESGLADVRALVARAKNVYPVNRKESSQ